MKKMTIVHDNAKSTGVIRQRDQQRAQLFMSSNACIPPPPPYMKGESRWSSHGSCSSDSNGSIMGRRKRPILRNEMQRFMNDGAFNMDQNLPQDSGAQRIESRVRERTCQIRDETSGSPSSPRLPMRRASIEDDEVARIAAMHVCREEEAKDNNNAKHTRATMLQLLPPAEPTRRTSDSVEPSKIKLDIVEWKSSLNVPRTRHSWNDQYTSLANAFHNSLSTRSNSESLATSTQRIASQIDRILKGLDFSGHSSSNNSELSADLILVPPVRRESWADEEEEEELSNGRCIGGFHSW